jgi:GNAT superfamily N-acetyltransferase
VVEPGLQPHPILPLLLAAAGDTFPPVDGQAVFLPPLGPDLQAVVSFTGHAVVATALPPSDFADLDLDGFGSALHPALLQRLAGRHGQVGVIDVTLAAQGAGGGALPERGDLDGHPRVRHARALREQVRVYGDERGLVTLGRGLAGRTELSIEIDTEQQGQGHGRSLIRDALGLAAAGCPVFAAVSPGNARSLRAFLAAGFRPIASEVIIVGR